MSTIGQPVSVPVAMPRAVYGLAAARLIPWPLALLLVAIVMPPETSVMAGSLRLSPYRIVLLIWFFPCLIAMMSGRAGKILLCDMFMIAHVCWAALAMFKNHGFAEIEASGVYGIEALGAYMMGRVYIRDSRTFRALAASLMLIVAVIGVFTVMETLTGRHLIREMAGRAFGHPFNLDIGKRLGMYRAYGPFDHPILLGVFAMSVLSLSWFALARNDKLNSTRIGRTLVVGIAGFTALSSGAFATMLVQLILIGYERLTRWLPSRWWMFVGALAAVYIFIDALSNRSGIKVFLSYLTFSEATAYNRLRIWTYGSAEVRRHPIFGIGAGDWQRPSWMHDSVDNFWLYTAMRFGLPGFMLLAATLIYIFWQMRRFKPRDIHGRVVCYSATDQGRVRLGWLFTVIGITVAASTVHLWNSVAVYFFLLIGSGVWMARPPAAPIRRVVRPTISTASPLIGAVAGKSEAA